MLGKQLLDREREREEREGSVISVAESMSRKKSTEQYEESFSSDSQRISLMNEISEKTWNEELNKLFLVKIQLRENYT